MQVFITLPDPVLVLFGVLALIGECALPIFAAGLPGFLIPFRQLDSPVWQSFGFLGLHAGIWAFTGMLFWANLPVCMAVAVTGSQIHYGDPNVLYANALVGVPLWIATWLYTEDWLVSHMGVFAYNKLQADCYAEKFHKTTHGTLAGRRVIAWAPSDTWSGPSIGDAVAHNLNVSDTNCTCINLASSVTRACCDGSFPTDAGNEFLDRVPDPHLDAVACATAAHHWLKTNPLFYDAHLCSVIREATVVELNADGKIEGVYGTSFVVLKTAPSASSNDPQEPLLVVSV